MRLTILLVAIISTAWAQTRNVERPLRAPQGQIQYDEIDGSRINWKYITPDPTKWRSQSVANAQRPQRAEGGSSHRLRQVQQTAPQHRAPAPQPQPQQVQQVKAPQYYSYKPYSAVPGHIRHLIESAYQSQAPYVDPSSFFYNVGYPSPQQPAPAASETSRAAYLRPATRYQSIEPRHNDRIERRNKIIYRNDYETQQQQQQQQQHQQQEQQQIATSPLAILPDPPTLTLYLDKNMPTEIKQLLQYQAQIPYDVTANRIQYRPKSIFIPKPLSDDDKGPTYYRSKIYYTTDDNVDAEYSQDKPKDEGQRH